jgi:hypothetical protein
MWWKLTLATLIGVVIGIALTTGVFYFSHTLVRDMQVGQIPLRWSSAGKEWSTFAEWLRLGGRRLVRDAAFSAARHGMNETQVRETFGPPDLVVGVDEVKSHPIVHLKGAGGAYFYKIGRFAEVPGKPISEVFAIIFDPSGNVMDRLGHGVGDGDALADIDRDTRSEQRIAP